MGATHHWDIGDRDNWSALMLTEMVASLVLFLAVIAGLWIILASLIN
jgi:hypothetical protein